MNLVRKIKISKLTNIPLTGVDKEIVDFINYKLSNLTPFKFNINTYYNYMDSEGKFVFTQSDKHNTLYVRYEGLWDVLDTKYGMLYEECEYILKFMIQKYLKTKVSKPYIASYNIYNKIEFEYYEKIFQFKRS